MISIIVPMRNAEATLEPVLRALLAQQFPENGYEILLVDNGSTDRSREIALRYPRVTLLEEPKRGSYAARNRGARETRGDILAFVDADRVVVPGWLRAVRDASQSTGGSILLGQSRPRNDRGITRLLADYENEKARHMCHIGDAGQNTVTRGIWP